MIAFIFSEMFSHVMHKTNIGRGGAVELQIRPLLGRWHPIWMLD